MADNAPRKSIPPSEPILWVQTKPSAKDAKRIGMVTVEPFQTTENFYYYENLLNMAGTKAQEKGANLIYVTKVTEPEEEFGGASFGLKADIFYTENLKKLISADSLKYANIRTERRKTAPYSTLYIERDFSLVRMQQPYTIHFNHCAFPVPLFTGNKYEVRLYSEQEIKVWIKNGKMQSINFKPKFGEVYEISTGYLPFAFSYLHKTEDGKKINFNHYKNAAIIDFKCEY